MGLSLGPGKGGPPAGDGPVLSNPLSILQLFTLAKDHLLYGLVS